MENNIINVPFGITNEFIDDVMCTALEGGINHWCDEVKVKYGDYRGAEFTSEVISRGGTLIVVFDDGAFVDFDEQSVELTKDNFIKGYQKYVDFAVSKKIDLPTDAGDIDSEIADMIIQFAVFDELIFG